MRSIVVVEAKEAVERGLELGGWCHLSTVLDDYSRKLLAWKLSARMRVEDVIETLDV